MTQMQRTGQDFAERLAQAARENPLPAALIGAGVLWLLAGNRAPAKAMPAIAGAGSAVSGAVGATTEAAASGLSSIGQSVAAAGQSVAKAVQDGGAVVADIAGGAQKVMARQSAGLTDQMGDIKSTVQSNLSDLFDGQPLWLGAVGLAIGAGIAAALPATAFEKDVMGEASAEMKAATEAMVTEKASAIKQAVASEAERQGLTPDAAKESLQAGWDKAKATLVPASDHDEM